MFEREELLRLWPRTSDRLGSTGKLYLQIMVNELFHLSKTVCGELKAPLTVSLSTVSNF